MPEQPPPAWYLISVLFSSVPLSAALAATLHQAAFALYTGGGSRSDVAGDLVSGEVRSLGKDMLLGTIGGPAFEAELKTERGHGKVRFLLTRQGLDLMGAAAAPHAGGPGRSYLN
jgi:hypothetical protein